MAVGVIHLLEMIHVYQKQAKYFVAGIPVPLVLGFEQEVLVADKGANVALEDFGEEASVP